MRRKPCKQIISNKQPTVFYKNPKYIDYNIEQLPKYLQYRIYVIAMRLYWRGYTPLYSKVPSWYYSDIKQQSMLLRARLHNIHFLHLPCNTLPSMKKYIIGCQCPYCLYEVDPLHKQEELYKSRMDRFYFYKTIPYASVGKWNQRYEIIGQFPDDVIYGLPYFNPDYEEYLDETPRFTYPNEPETL